MEIGEGDVKALLRNVNTAFWNEFVHCLETGDPIPEDIRTVYAKKLKHVDTDQESTLLGAQLVRAFGLDKTGMRVNNFQRDCEIARRVIVGKERQADVAKDYALSARQISNIVSNYRPYIEADEIFFPTKK